MNLDRIQIVPECLKTMIGWGHDTVYNVCRETSQVIPWGFMDYMGWILFVVIIIIIIISLIVAITSVINSF